MIFDISDAAFKNLFGDQKLHLPIRWDGGDYLSTLIQLLNDYLHKLKWVQTLPNGNGGYPSYTVDITQVQQACIFLAKATQRYLNGFPSKAYILFKRAMEIFMTQPLEIYEKSKTEQFEIFDEEHKARDSLKLFRATSVVDNKPYGRERAFHTPYNLRSKVSTSRYSIAGYPSLYLGTSLELCCEEIQMNPYRNFTLASVFKLERKSWCSNINIQVIELGIKPQDFIEEIRINKRGARRTNASLLGNMNIRSAYLLWYPLIAACSHIRTNKDDPFAAEYIIPQLLMQWVRSEVAQSSTHGHKKLIGIRYFSCASIRASDMGFNYVFPTSGKQNPNNPTYCDILSKSFYLSTPVYVHEYESVQECERYLRDVEDFKSI